MRNILKWYHEITAISVTLSAWTGWTAVFTPSALWPVYSLDSLPVGTQIQLVQIEWVNTYVFLHNGSEIWSLTITTSSWYNFDSVRVSGTIVTSTAITLNNWNAIEVFFVMDTIVIKLNYNPSIAPHLHWENDWWSSINVLNIWWSYYFLGWDWEELQLWIPNTETISMFCKFNSWYWLDGLAYTLGWDTIPITTSTQPFQLSDGWEFNATEQELPIELRTYVVDENGNNMLGIWWDWIGWGLEPQTDYYSTTLPLTSEYFQVTSAYSPSSWQLSLTIDGDRLLRLAVAIDGWYNFVSLEYWAFVDWTGFDRFQTITPTDDWVRYNTYQTYTTMGKYPLALELIVEPVLYELSSYSDSSQLMQNLQTAIRSSTGFSSVNILYPQSYKYIIEDLQHSAKQYWLLVAVLNDDWSNPMWYSFYMANNTIRNITRESSLDWWSVTWAIDNIFRTWTDSAQDLWLSWVSDINSLWEYLAYRLS